VADLIPDISLGQLKFRSFERTQHYAEAAEWLLDIICRLLKELRRARPRNKQVERILKDILEANIPNKILTYLRSDLFNILFEVRKHGPTKPLLKVLQEGIMEISRLWQAQIKYDVEKTLYFPKQSEGSD